MKYIITIIILFLIIKNNHIFSIRNFFILNEGQVKLTDIVYKSHHLVKFMSKEKIRKIDLWKRNSFFRGVNIHPFKHFSPYSMREPIQKKDLEELKDLGANLVVANYPGVFKYFPPYEIDSIHLYNLDRIVELTSRLNLYLVISLRSGPGRSLYTFFDKNREDDFALTDSVAKIKYIEMCRFITERYKKFKNLIGINFILEPHFDDPVLLPAITDSIYFEFVDEIIKNVREIDDELPVIVQPQGWAYPDKFLNMKKFDDDKIVYSINMYFPHSFTNEKNDSTYPGFFHVRDTVTFIDSIYLVDFLKPVVDFKNKHDIPVFVNEYGGIKFKKGFYSYLSDLHNLFLSNGFHFAYYVWRSGWGEIDGNTFFDYDLQNSDIGENNRLIEEFEKVWRTKR